MPKFTLYNTKPGIEYNTINEIKSRLTEQGVTDFIIRDNNVCVVKNGDTCYGTLPKKYGLEEPLCNPEPIEVTDEDIECFGNFGKRAAFFCLQNILANNGKNAAIIKTKNNGELILVSPYKEYTLKKLDLNKIPKS